MNPIELTDLQKSKLLEMCRILFPKEYIDFGFFYTSEAGAEYVGLDYLDVTSVNHKIPCMKSGFRLNPPRDKNGDSFKKFQDGFCSNTKEGQIGFMIDEDGNILQDSQNYDEIYVEGIHWFEFCVTKLINELASQNISSDLFGDCEFEEFRMKCINEIFKDKPSDEIIHPIDYLYEQFKQLKINK